MNPMPENQPTEPLEPMNNNPSGKSRLILKAIELIKSILVELMINHLLGLPSGFRKSHPRGARARVLLLALLLFSWLETSGQSLAAIQFTTINVPSAHIADVEGTWATGISGSNIVGYFDPAEIGGVQGFLLSGTTFTILQALGSAPETYATGISGDTIVGYYVDINNYTDGFEYQITSGDYTQPLDPPDATGNTTMLGISGSDVVGSYDSNAAGFLYNGADFQSLPYPPGITGTNGIAFFPQAVSGNLIVGYYASSSQNYFQGFILSGSTYVTASLDDPLGPLDGPGDLFGVAGTEALGTDGTNVVGYYVDKIGGDHGFLYSNGKFTTIDDPQGIGGTILSGISGTTVVGYYYDKNDGVHGFVAKGVSVTGSTETPHDLTVLLSATDTNPAIPDGIGYATLKVNTKDQIVMAGKLPDGEGFNSTGTLVSGSEYTINSSLTYPSVATKKSKGSLAGTLTFVTETGTSDLNGTLTWTKPAQTKGSYPAEFATNLNVIGSLYTPPPRGGSVLPGFTSGILEVSDSSGVILSATANLTAKNALTIQNPPDKIKATITASTGVFKGSFLYPIPGKKSKSTAFTGVLFQDQTNGAGYFLGPDGSGSITLAPSP
jgi:hypothetical protein